MISKLMLITKRRVSLPHLLKVRAFTLPSSRIQTSESYTTKLKIFLGLFFLFYL
jgi:hypothetical protein